MLESTASACFFFFLSSLPLSPSKRLSHNYKYEQMDAWILFSLSDIWRGVRIQLDQARLPLPGALPSFHVALYQFRKLP